MIDMDMIKSGSSLIATICLFSTMTLAQVSLEHDMLLTGLDSLPGENQIVMDNFMFFDANKGALRGGSLNGIQWESNQIAPSSFAFGYDVEASGIEGATALGRSIIASGPWGATAMGRITIASGGDGAAAMWYFAEARGNQGSVAIGNNTISAGNSCIA